MALIKELESRNDSIVVIRMWREMDGADFVPRFRLYFNEYMSALGMMSEAVHMMHTNEYQGHYEIDEDDEEDQPEVKA